ncbi:hypothetical protein RchiOBHm_Chr2g0170261 [Rosa chinensis]|uniref:Uncharacterized protein n=1 Tax=Rosa chinensis TaxID=74649 RepID=A0A2P6S523_ROSCH|nr:hypothetical protein RchiOBHm_Chr2g0170261 [Rosa chinensis]
MASKSSLISHFTLAFLLLTLFTLLSCANAEETHNKTSSPVEFVEHLNGSHKGEVKSISDLQKFLKKFGFLELNYKIHNYSNDDEDFVEEGIKTLTTSCYYGVALTLLLYGFSYHS